MSVQLFTSRTGGFSTGSYEGLNLGLHVGDEASLVLKNRTQLRSNHGPIVFMNQTHSNEVCVVQDDSTTPDCDGLITTTSGLTLAVQVADCIPLLLKSDNCVAAVHVGRKGLMNGITSKTISMMGDVSDGEISALIGPHICALCYEVGQDLFDVVRESRPDACAQTRDGKPSLDLRTSLSRELEELGVQVRHDMRCTVETPDLYSYRRDGVTGRFAGLISL